VDVVNDNDSYEEYDLIEDCDELTNDLEMYESFLNLTMKNDKNKNIKEEYIFMKTIYDAKIKNIQTKYDNHKLNFECKQMKRELIEYKNKINRFTINMEKISDKLNNILKDLIDLLKIIIKKFSPCLSELMSISCFGNECKNIYSDNFGLNKDFSKPDI